jgi:hypothetical protein
MDLIDKLVLGFGRQPSLYWIGLAVSLGTYLMLFMSCLRGFLLIHVFPIKAFKIGFLLVAISLLAVFLSCIIYQFLELLDILNGNFEVDGAWWLQTGLDFVFSILMYVGCTFIIRKLKHYFGKDDQ